MIPCHVIMWGPPYHTIQGAVVTQSDEDTQTFTISGANGEEYRLRAADARERQHWVVRLRKETEDATNILRGTKEVSKVWREHVSKGVKL